MTGDGAPDVGVLHAVDERTVAAAGFAEHGGGVAAANALSDWLRLDVWGEGKAQTARFERGDPVTPVGVNPLRA